MPDDYLPDDYQPFVMCAPCADVRHDECLGGVEFCMCFVELMWEAEEMTDEPS